MRLMVDKGCRLNDDGPEGNPDSYRGIGAPPSIPRIDRSIASRFYLHDDDVTKGVPMPISHIHLISHLKHVASWLSTFPFGKLREEERKRKREREKERKREREKERETAASWGHMRSFTS